VHECSYYDIEQIDIWYKENCFISQQNNKVVEYLSRNKTLSRGHKSKLLHGNYTTANQMLEYGKLILVDFDMMRFGNPLEELGTMIYIGIPISYSFVTGQIHGYFGRNPSELEWQYLLFYTALEMLRLSRSATEYTTYAERSRQFFKWFNSKNNEIPFWYNQYIEEES